MKSLTLEDIEKLEEQAQSATDIVDLRQLGFSLMLVAPQLLKLAKLGLTSKQEQV